MNLITAAKTGDRDRVLHLLASGVDVDVADDGGWTALSWAAAAGELALVSDLCEHGADVFHQGIDHRTPYLIAIAAQRFDVARRLAEAERERGGDLEGCSSRQQGSRSYCKAYPLHAFEPYPTWQELTGGLGEPLEAVLFLHRDYRVTRSMWAGEQVVFDFDTPEWRTFCDEVLRFSPPSDFDRPATVPGSAGAGVNGA